MKSASRSSDTSLDNLVTSTPAQAVQWLQAGYLLAYPTESVWGIGCDPFNESAVKQLLAIKQRPMHKGMILVTDSVERIASLLAALKEQQRQYIVESWQPAHKPQALQAQTWLLPLPNALNPPIPNWITGDHDSVAVRVIAHPLIGQLCAQMVTPNNPYGFIVSTSCNPSGKSPAATLKQAQRYFRDNHSEDLTKNVHYLAGETLGYQLPSQINEALTGHVIR